MVIYLTLGNTCSLVSITGTSFLLKNLYLEIQVIAFISHTNEFSRRYWAHSTPVLLSYSDLFTFLSFQIKFSPLATAFRCGQNIHSIKYEIENTNIILKGVNESNCINSNSKMLERSIKITKIPGREI